MSTYLCPSCGARSSNPMDKAEGYCGFCHAYTGPSAEDLLPIVTIYHDPDDFPAKYVARRFWATSAGVAVPETHPIAITDTLDQVRDVVPPGMVCLHRQPEDDPTIVETWI